MMERWSHYGAKCLKDWRSDNMETIIVTGQATTDALSGAAGTSNMITLYDAPKIRDVVSAKIIGGHDASGQMGILSDVAAASGMTLTIGLSGTTITNLYPVARASLGSGTITSGQIAICSGVTASGATVQVATYSGMAATIGDQIGVSDMLILKVSTRGEIVRK